ncbi:phosphoserine phosphatase SerB [Aestuariispira insulae]|uniref:Phosphoserine phosphatase n=1 Tax=Aestuariispira insulae TaxID=1461337 RepID=A0A3D9HXV6_9PROT|nr:phosphoserine phosphatase SerB [Aestuariispira insulae]RED54201.1 phosphoserine phosphatase [Aestuariispira insulae]
MPIILTLVSPVADTGFADMVGMIADRLQQQGGIVGEPRWLSPDRAGDLEIQGLDQATVRHLAHAQAEGLDYAVQTDQNRRKKLLLADMDSTMIQLESLDSLAAELGFGQQVEEITERGMRGELDFRESLRTRVALLEGQPTTAMAKVMENIPYTPGAEVTVKTMVAHGCHTALVSGGFTFTTDVVHAKLGFHEHRANRLEIIDGYLTGKVIEPILGRDSKRLALEELSNRLGIPQELTCAIGDGANDLDMLETAGMGVGYHGKPIVLERAPFNIRHGDMTTLLYFQGYADIEFVSL